MHLNISNLERIRRGICHPNPHFDTFPCFQVEMKRYNGMTPLMAAALKGHLDIVTILVRHNNTALESRDRAGDTALVYAVRG